MQITDVRIRLLSAKSSEKGKMRAVASITLDDEFVVHDLKVIEGTKGLFIAMPSKKDGNGDYVDVAHPLNSETREKLSALVLEEYENALKKKKQEEAEADSTTDPAPTKEEATEEEPAPTTEE